MATLAERRTQERTDDALTPPLENGDRLTRAEFERRYDAMPEVKKAELIEGLDNEPQPDALLMIEPQRGGQARISDVDYVEGAPELVLEIAASRVSMDLRQKVRVYRRSGVREYVVWRVVGKS